MCCCGALHALSITAVLSACCDDDTVADTENKAKWHKLGRKWRKIGSRLKQLKMQVQETENVLAFSFMEVSGPDGGLVDGNGLFKPHQWKPLGGWTGYFDLCQPHRIISGLMLVMISLGYTVQWWLSIYEPCWFVCPTMKTKQNSSFTVVTGHH